jgi:hypothetical protein
LKARKIQTNTDKGEKEKGKGKRETSENKFVS